MNTPSPKDRPRLGTRVRFNAVANRRFEGDEVRWTNSPIDSTEGLYVGYRLKYSGVMYHDPTYLKRTSTVSLALVVTHERKNSALVPWDALEW